MIEDAKDMAGEASASLSDAEVSPGESDPLAAGEDAAYVAAVWKRRADALRVSRRLERSSVVEAEAEKGRKAHWLLARIGPRLYALPVGHVVSVVELPPGATGTPVPGAPMTFWGLLTIKGEIRPIFDGASLLAVPADESQKGDGTDSENGDSDISAHILLLRPTMAGATSSGVDSDLVGLRVDHAEGVLHLSPAIYDAEAAQQQGETSGRFVQQAVPMPEAGNTAGTQRFALTIDVSRLLAHLRGDGTEADTPAGQSPHFEENVT